MHLMFGPTTGDAIRLADTELWAQIEHDYTVYGDECKFGGGKVIRDGMGQSSGATREQGVLDTLITNAVIIDHWGIVKGDIGIQGWSYCRYWQSRQPRYYGWRAS